MKRITTLLIVFMAVLCTGILQAQFTTNTEKLLEISDRLSQEWQEKEQRVLDYTYENDVPLTYESDGVFYQMIDVIDGKPVYYRTDNYGAAITTRANQLWEGGNSGLELTGQGYLHLGEWDAGAVRVSHQEFTDQGNSRVIMQDGASATHYHATHVAGTMVAGGVNINAKGMAYGGALKAWQWSNDEAEMAAAAANGLQISNHSYGQARGWQHNNGNWVWYGTPSISPDEDYKFGFYDSGSRQWDEIAHNAPYYLIVKSAGNDRGEGPGNAGNGEPEVDGGDDGYDCISPKGVAKNLLTVGAVFEVPEYTGPESVNMSDFSCWGPADDGRIKPDIVGKGVDVYSTMDGSNNDYGSLQGTSMSAPNVSGSMALLQLHYNNLFGDYMLSSTLKGLVLHTADEAGDHDGPDYIYGWGLMNAERAASVISDNEGQDVIDEIVLSNGNSYTREVTVPEGSDLRVTICWTDVPGSPVSPQLNPDDPMIVNDLDLRIEDANQNIYYPYSLDRDNPSAAATTTGKNYVDNVEMILMEGIEAGNYTITVDHDGTLAGGGQVFSLIISGIDEYTSLPQCSNDLITPENGGSDAFINHTVVWKPALFASSYDVYFGTDGGGTSTPTNVFNGENFTSNEFTTLLEPGTEYFLQVVPRNSFGTAENCDVIWSFTTMESITAYPYLVDMEDLTIPAIPDLWQQKSFTAANWISSDLASHSSDQAMICYNSTGFVQMDFDNWFISPPFSLAVGNEYNIRYFYRPLIGGSPESMTLYYGSSPFIEDLTNVLYDEPFAGDWEEASAMIIPDSDQVVYFGFHMNSTSGYGGFIDDFQVIDWGTVGIEDTENTKMIVYQKSDHINIQVSDSWSGSNVVLTNILGQQIHSSNMAGTSTMIPNNHQPGLYFISLIKNDEVITKKVVIQ